MKSLTNYIKEALISKKISNSIDIVVPDDYSGRINKEFLDKLIKACEDIKNVEYIIEIGIDTSMSSLYLYVKFDNPINTVTAKKTLAEMLIKHVNPYQPTFVWYQHQGPNKPWNHFDYYVFEYAGTNRICTKVGAMINQSFDKSSRSVEII